MLPDRVGDCAFPNPHMVDPRVGVVAAVHSIVRDAVIALITEFPSEFTVQFATFSYTLERATFVEPLAGVVREIAVSAASAAPVLGVNYPTLSAFGALRVGLVRELGLKPIRVGGKSATQCHSSRL